MKSVKARHSKHNPPRLWGNSRGQAVVEYMLVLVVGVMLVGVVAQFYKPFGRFVQFYFSDHLQCLLETGELPGAGGTICGDDFQSRLAKVSTETKGGLQSRTSSGSTNNQKPPDASQSREQKKSPQAASSSNASSSSPGGSSSGGGENGRGADRNAAGRQVLAGRISLNQKDESSYTGSSAVSSGRFVGALGSGQRQSISTQYFVIDETPRGGRSVASSSSLRGKNGADVDQLRPKKTRDTFKPRAAILGGEDEGFSLGFAFRLLIIIAIILAIVLLVGGQLMQISKSME